MFTLEQKRKYIVFENGDYAILKYPIDIEFVHQEGLDMNHCLGCRSIAEAYTQRMQNGEQEQYSLISLKDGKPRVDIELSLTQSSYDGPVSEPTITQIRGYANQCPPDDEYLDTIHKFFELHPEWKVKGHKVVNFDRQIDGDRFYKAYKRLHNDS